MLNNKKTTNGFTIIELMVGVSIFIIFMVLSSEYIIRGLKLTRFADEQETAVNTTKKILNSMVSEIRESAHSDTGEYLLDTVEPQELSFYSDIDSDIYKEKIRYFVDGHLLKKGIIEATSSPLEYPSGNEIITTEAEYINNQDEAIFTYYDTNYNQIASSTADKNDIRLIHIFLKVNVTPEIMPADYLMNMDVQIRNLKDNL